VLEGPQGKFVYTMAGGKAIPKPVVVGEQLADGWLVQKGLDKGDQVIVDGMARIFFPGAPVVLAPAPGTAGASGSGTAPAASAPAQAASK
jgi:membrane fusion protein (multidrug efflux system)